MPDIGAILPVESIVHCPRENKTMGRAARRRHCCCGGDGGVLSRLRLLVRRYGFLLWKMERQCILLLASLPKGAPRERPPETTWQEFEVRVQSQSGRECIEAYRTTVSVYRYLHDVRPSLPPCVSIPYVKNSPCTSGHNTKT